MMPSTEISAEVCNVLVERLHPKGIDWNGGIPSANAVRVIEAWEAGQLLGRIAETFKAERRTGIADLLSQLWGITVDDDPRDTLVLGHAELEVLERVKRACSRSLVERAGLFSISGVEFRHDPDPFDVSPGERLMVLAAWDVWNGRGKLRWMEAIDRLDRENLSLLQSLTAAYATGTPAAFDRWLQKHSTKGGGQ
jgi:hypothetical protein